MTAPGRTPFDRLLGWYTVLGALILLAAGIGWRESPPTTRYALLLLGGAASVSAHSAVRDTDPREGSVLKSAPREVTMTFTESVGEQVGDPASPTIAGS